MSDRDHARSRDEPSGAAHAAVRDALPSLLHGRASASERGALLAHLAECTACAAEYRMLGLLRAAHAAPSPAVSVDGIAAAVRARTVPAVAPASVAVASASAAPPIATARQPRRAPAWASRRGVRAFAATALVAIGSGALVLRGAGSGAPPSGTRPTPSGATTAAAATPASARDANASLLGASFSDLSESELAAVVAAVADPAAASPGSEPTPVAPSVLAPDSE